MCVIIIVNILDGWLDGIDFPLLFLVKEVPGVLRFLFLLLLSSISPLAGLSFAVLLCTQTSDISLHSCFTWSLWGLQHGAPTSDIA